MTTLPAEPWNYAVINLLERAPRTLFETAVPDLENARNRYAVSRDSRFLINTVLGEETSRPIVLNWGAGKK